MNTLQAPPPQAKWPRVAAALRRRIVAGEFPPGARFPTLPEISREYRVSEGTAQVVVNYLARLRFIETRGRLGTFVRPDPPHLAHYVIVYPWGKNQGAYQSKFIRAIQEAATALPVPPDCDVTEYWGASPQNSPSEYRKLLYDVTHDRVAGLIFVSTPFPWQGTAVLDQPGIPRVAISDASEFVKFPRVYPDFEQWYARAFARIAATGRRRVAALLPLTSAWRGDTDVQAAAAACGLTVPPLWIQYAPVDEYAPYGLAKRMVQLLCSGRAAERPDVLLVTDDNLLEPALAGIAAAGLRVGEDVVVVTHCNFPCPPPADGPVIQIGFDVPAIMRHCVDLITKQRQGEAAAAVTLVPPREVEA